MEFQRLERLEGLKKNDKPNQGFQLIYIGIRMRTEQVKLRISTATRAEQVKLRHSEAVPELAAAHKRKGIV